MSSTALRIGILGAANIARQFVRDVAASERVRVVAVASRTAENAAAFADTFDIDRRHASYEALLGDPQVDAIYLPLPNSMHAEWGIRAADAGKHVLCEKPLALGVAEAHAMFDAARRGGVILLESIPYLFQPQTFALRALLDQGAVGAVRSMQAVFGFTVPNPDRNIRLKPELGGGALLDAGSYPVSLIRLAMGEAPRRVRADARWHESGVDIAMMATFEYADGRRAQLSCAMNTAYHRHASIEASEGAIETDYLNHTSPDVSGDAWGYIPGRLRVRRGTAISNRLDDVVCETGSGFRFAAETFADIVARRDVPAMDRAARASLDNAATLEALARSARAQDAAEVRTD